MKILMLVDFYSPFLGGIASHTRWLGKDLVGRGHDVTVCTVGASNLPEYEEQAGVKIHRVRGLFQRAPLIYRDPGRKRPPPIMTYVFRSAPLTLLACCGKSYTTCIPFQLTSYNISNPSSIQSDSSAVLNAAGKDTIHI